jgi:hypothetical protein
MKYPRQTKKPNHLAEALRELKRLRAEVAKAEAEAVARRQQRTDGPMRDGDSGNDSSGAP